MFRYRRDGCEDRIAQEAKYILSIQLRDSSQFTSITSTYLSPHPNPTSNPTSNPTPPQNPTPPPAFTAINTTNMISTKSSKLAIGRQNSFTSAVPSQKRFDSGAMSGSGGFGGPNAPVR